MKKQYVFLKSIGNLVEEEVTLKLESGLEVTCFLGYCPKKVYIGQKYLASFEPLVFYDYKIKELKYGQVGLERIGNSFSYWVTGILQKGVIDCGIKLRDDLLLSDYGYLDSKLIQMKVDRIDVELF